MSIKFTLLGCGSSMGVPRIDGFFGKCNPKNKKNYRTRCSALISSKKKNILIDTSPDLRQQLIKNKIANINSVFYTHYHADQTHGINDLRAFFLKNKTQIPVYCDKQTMNFLTSNFKYCFVNFKGYPAILKINSLKKVHSFDSKNNNIRIEYFEVKHGFINSLGYLINKKCAYISDVNEIYKKDFKKLFGIKTFVVDCLKFKKHPTHFNLNEVLSLVEKLKPKKTILTNLHTDLDYDELKRKLPKNVIPAYDGLSFNI